MARTTAAQVIGLLLDDYNSVSNPSLTPRIDSANVIVTRVQACAVTKGVTLTAQVLELIERWLAAHLYTQSDPLYKERQTGKASAVFVDRDYLKNALALDASGCLNGIMNRQSGRVVWLGKRPSDQTDYRDRS
jgi:hypothetical protein